MASHNTSVYISYNIGTSSNLAGLQQLVDMYKPKFVFLQECTLDSLTLQAVLKGGDYLGVSNIDDLDRNKPGTATLWLKGLEGVVVANLVPRRIQYITTDQDGIFINSYAPTGTKGEKEHRLLFSQDLLPMVQGAPTKPIMVGDWNCIVDRGEVGPVAGGGGNIAGGGAVRKIQHELKSLIRDGEYTDGFTYANPGVNEYTWIRQGQRQSRLDRVYFHKSRLESLVSVFHVAHQSDHKALVFTLKGGSAIPVRDHIDGYWKLNSAILKDKQFKHNFAAFYAKVGKEKEWYDGDSEWFDQAFKPQCRDFLINFSVLRQRARRDTVGLLSHQLDEAYTRFDWSTVARCRVRLRRLLQEDTMGLVVRSRCQGRAEAEVASLYHLNRVVKNGKRGRLDKLAKLVDRGPNVPPDRIVLEERGQVKDEAVNFFTALLQGHHRENGTLGDSPFEPDFKDLNYFLKGLGRLSPEQAVILENEVSFKEVEDAIKFSKNNKSPGFDGLTSELFKSESELFTHDLMNVMNDQLARLRLMDSDLVGALRLASKVEGVPLVTELRPITLLNASYKLLSWVLARRLTLLLGTLLRSAQSCSKPGGNICSSAVNLISTVESVSRQLKGKGAIMSLDLFKAYDRVNLRFLERVLEAMGLPETFISWVLLLHEGATSRLLLDFITDPIDLTFSVRQGDPIAMILFLLYVEPLMLRLEEGTTGVAMASRQVRDLQASEIISFYEKIEGYVDDIQVVCGSLEDIIAADNIVRRFENVSGAILNRSTKSMIMGLGEWVGRTQWPLPWIKSVTSLKVYGIILSPVWAEMIEQNWSSQFKQVQDTLRGWGSRVLDTVAERAYVLNTFALSKTVYRAQIIPMSDYWVKKIEKVVYDFLWRGQITLNTIKRNTICLPKSRGGLGLSRLRLKTNALLLKQYFRMLNGGGISKKHLNFWLGGRMRTDQLPDVFHHIRPLVRGHTDTTAPLFVEYLVQFEQGRLEHWLDLTSEADLSTKAMYGAQVELLPPPDVVLKYPGTDWPTCWKRWQSGVLSKVSRDILLFLLHEKCGTRVLMNRIFPSRSEICPRCERWPETEIHRYMRCSSLSGVWDYVRARLVQIDESLTWLGDEHLLYLSFPSGLRDKDILWLLGVYLDYVEDKVVKRGQAISVDDFVGHAKYNREIASHEAMPDLGVIPGTIRSDVNAGGLRMDTGRLTLRPDN